MTDVELNEIKRYRELSVNRLNNSGYLPNSDREELIMLEDKWAAIDTIALLFDEIKRLKEIEWMYNDLCR